MKLDKKKSIEIAGIVSLVASLIFVGVEINQSNTIATHNAEAQLRAIENDFTQAYVSTEALSVLAKLSENSQLSLEENIFAGSFLTGKLNVWATAESAQRNGLVESYVYDLYMAQIINFFTRFPGLIPILRQTLSAVAFEGVIEEATTNSTFITRINSAIQSLE